MIISIKCETNLEIWYKNYKIFNISMYISQNQEYLEAVNYYINETLIRYILYIIYHILHYIYYTSIHTIY